MTEEEAEKFEQLLLKDANHRQIIAKEVDEKIRNADEYDTMQLY